MAQRANNDFSVSYALAVMPLVSVKPVIGIKLSYRLKTLK